MNDQPPEFTSPPEGFILENQPANTVVMSVSTRDLNADVERRRRKRISTENGDDEPGNSRCERLSHLGCSV